MNARPFTVLQSARLPLIQPAGAGGKRSLATGSRRYLARWLQRVNGSGGCKRRSKAGWKDDNRINFTTTTKRVGGRAPAVSVFADGHNLSGMYHANTLGHAFRRAFSIPATICKQCDVFG
jgi:hypothetical protein